MMVSRAARKLFGLDSLSFSDSSRACLHGGERSVEIAFHLKYAGPIVKSNVTVPLALSIDLIGRESFKIFLCRERHIVEQFDLVDGFELNSEIEKNFSDEILRSSPWHGAPPFRNAARGPAHRLPLGV